MIIIVFLLIVIVVVVVIVVVAVVIGSQDELFNEKVRFDSVGIQRLEDGGGWCSGASGSSPHHGPELAKSGSSPIEKRERLVVPA